VRFLLTKHWKKLLSQGLNSLKNSVNLQKTHDYMLAAYIRRRLTS